MQADKAATKPYCEGGTGTCEVCVGSCGIEEYEAANAAKVSGHGKPQDWPDKCGNCGAHWSMIGFDYADGFNCRKCGACDADE